MAPDSLQTLGSATAKPVALLDGVMRARTLSGDHPR
jgi:hypothetical protein